MAPSVAAPLLRSAGRSARRRGRPRLPTAVATAPATFSYLLTLAVTTGVLQLLGSRAADRLLASQSTNLDHLARDPVRVLVGSAFWLSSSSQALVWLPLFVGVVARVERRLGPFRTIGVFAAGHVGATLLTAAVLWAGLHAGVVASSVAHARDVGASYGFFAVAAAASGLLDGRRARAYALVVCAYPALMLALGPTFTDVGHALAVSIGFACAPAVRARAATVNARAGSRASRDRSSPRAPRAASRAPAARSGRAAPPSSSSSRARPARGTASVVRPTSTG
jgi:hypothetical protein